jgi:hypothetical protein
MRTFALTCALAFGFAGGVARAQYPATQYPSAVPPPVTAPAPSVPPPPVMTSPVPPGANPDTGARPGNEIGTGMSLPLGTAASNIGPSTTGSTIAPNLPSPAIGPNATAVDYLNAARGALVAGKTGEAQQSLEMAQTRLLDRSVPLFQTKTPSSNPAVQQISQALQALGAGDIPGCARLIDAAIPNARRAEAGQ